MNLVALLRTLCLAFSLQGVRPLVLPTTDGTDGEPSAISSGMVRFGVELETAIKISPEIAHPDLVNTWNTRYEKGKNHSTVWKQVRDVLVKEWPLYEPSTDEIENNKYLKAAYATTEADPNAKSDFEKPGFRDRWDNWARRSADAVKDVTRYNYWSITRERYIECNLTAFEFPVEFIGPVMVFGTSDYTYLRSRYQMELFFSFLNHLGILSVQVYPRISTHVHISPLDDPVAPNVEIPDGRGNGFGWTLDRLRRVAAASLFFEPALRSLLPAYRWTVFYAQEYRDAFWQAHWGVPDFANNTEKDNKGAALEVVKLIEEKDDFHSLQLYMNPRRWRPGEAGRTWGFNFMNMQDKEGKGTVEWRRGGQTMNASDAMLWVEMAASFMLAACAHGTYDELQRFDINRTTSLHEFLYYQWPKTYYGNGTNSTPLGYQTDFRYIELDKRFGRLDKGLDPTTLKPDYKHPGNNLKSGWLQTKNFIADLWDKKMQNPN